jgi:hypothetical protein
VARDERWRLRNAELSASPAHGQRQERASEAVIPTEEREVSTLEEALALVDEWVVAYRALWFDYYKLNDQLIDAKMDCNMADARLVLMQAEQTLREHPVRRISRFHEMVLDERDPFG